MLGGIVTLRVLFALPRLLRAPDQVFPALLAIAAAAAAGGAGGAVYAITRPPLRKLGRLGDYLSGIAAVGGYLGALILAAPIAFGEPLLEGSSSWIVWVIAAVGFGLIFGHTFFKRD